MIFTDKEGAGHRSGVDTTGLRGMASLDVPDLIDAKRLASHFPASAKIAAAIDGCSAIASRGRVDCAPVPRVKLGVADVQSIEKWSRFDPAGVLFRTVEQI